MSTEVKAGLITVRGEPIPLKGVEIAGEVSGALARVRLIQRYRNEESRAIEAVYTFPLPSDATLARKHSANTSRRSAPAMEECSSIRSGTMFLPRRSAISFRTRTRWWSWSTCSASPWTKARCDG